MMEDRMEPLFSPTEEKTEDLDFVVEMKFDPMFTIKEEHPETVDLTTEECTSVVSKRQTYKRKLPPKKSRRKRFHRPKTHGKNYYKIRALAAVKEDHLDKPLSTVADDSTSNPESKEDQMPNTSTQNDSNSNGPFFNSLQHERMSRVHPSLDETPPVTDPVSVNKQTVQKIQMRKVMPNKDIIINSTFHTLPPKPSALVPRRSRFVLVNSSQNPNCKVIMLKPVVEANVDDHPAHNVMQPEFVGVSSKIDHFYFMDESSNHQDQPEPEVMTKEMVDKHDYNTTVSHLTPSSNILTAPPRSFLGVPGIPPYGNIAGSCNHPVTVNKAMSPRDCTTVKVELSAPPTTQQLLEKVKDKLCLPFSWMSVLRDNGIAVCLLSRTDIVTIQRSIFVESSGTVHVGVHGKKLPPEHDFWQCVQKVELRADSVEEYAANVQRMMYVLRGMEVCKAVEDYQSLWKTMENCEIDFNRFHELRFTECCRSEKCHILVPCLKTKRCAECSKVAKTLSRRSTVEANKPETMSINKPFKYMTSPERRERFERAVKDIRSLTQANSRLKEKLNQLTQFKSEESFRMQREVDTEVADDMQIMDEE